MSDGGRSGEGLRELCAGDGVSIQDFAPPHITPEELRFQSTDSIGGEGIELTLEQDGEDVS